MQECRLAAPHASYTHTMEYGKACKTWGHSSISLTYSFDSLSENNLYFTPLYRV